MYDIYIYIYYDFKNSASFSSIRALYHRAKQEDNNKTLKQVRHFLEGQQVYTLHKRIRRKFLIRKIVVRRIHSQLQTDLIDVSGLK